MSMNCRVGIALATVLITSAASFHSAMAGPMFNLTPIAGLSGSASSEAIDVNNKGQVIGNSSTGDAPGSTQPFLVSDGQTTALTSSTGTAIRINNNGVVLGRSDDPAIGPFLSSPGLTPLDRTSVTLANPGVSPATLFVNDLNDRAAYIGHSNDTISPFGDLPSPQSHPIMAYNKSSVTEELDEGDGVAVNNLDHAITLLTGRHPNASFLDNNVTNGKLSTSSQVLYNSDPNAILTIRGLNDSDMVVGSAVDPNGSGAGAPHAFTWKAGQSQDLGTLGGPSSRGLGINGNGAIVGSSDVQNGANPHAFLYLNGQMSDLNAAILPSLNWQLVQANRINDLGQIVGWGINPDGQKEGFFLTPTDATTFPAPASVPEPTSLALFGLTGLTAWLRRPRRS